VRSTPINEADRDIPVRVDAEHGTTSLIFGCMFSGKTTELINRVERYPSESVVAIKHAIDTRFGRDAIISHGGKALGAITVSCAREIMNVVETPTQIVAIDEGHFFDLDLQDVVKVLNERGVDFVVASLEPDSWGRPFPINELLREGARECVVKSAICARCGAVADRTQRLTPVVAGNMVVDPSQYEPRCRACWRAPVLA
jgi:thymidine kinase